MGRDLVPSTPRVSKLATDNYYSDDGYNLTRTPPLVRRTVTLKSPSPEYLAPLARSPSPDCAGTSRTKVPRRRQKTQASQGDAVLIGFLGGQNLPDIARKAGEEPLNSASQSEASDPASPMDVEDRSAVEDNGINLIQTAQNALPLVDDAGRSGDEKSRRPKLDDKRSLSKLYTLGLPRDIVMPDADGSKVKGYRSEHQITSNPKTSEVQPNDKDGARAVSPTRSPPALSRPNQLRRSSSSTSPLRKYAIPPSERSPMELLPAMRTSLPSLSAQSPNGQQTLPPFHSQFPNLKDDRIMGEKASRSNTISTNRPPFPLDGNLNSPSLSSLGPRSGQYPSPQTRLNGNFSHPYPPAQPSPASTYSDASPRETYRPSSDPTSMSPRARFGPNQYYSNGRTPKGGESTPLSAESYQSSGNYSTDTSPNDDQTNAEASRPVLPPLGSGVQLMAGLFKCEHAGCTAAPFQTQYLLK